MYEQVFSAFIRSDETVTLLITEPLDGAPSQSSLSLSIARTKSETFLRPPLGSALLYFKLKPGQIGMDLFAITRFRGADYRTTPKARALSDLSVVFQQGAVARLPRMDRHPAIDHQVHSGDEGGVVRSQECHGGRDLGTRENNFELGIGVVDVRSVTARRGKCAQGTGDPFDDLPVRRVIEGCEPNFVVSDVELPGQPTPVRW